MSRTDRASKLPGETAARLHKGRENRTAIIELDGKILRALAEGFARLHPDRPPGDMPPRRWLRFVDDVGLFLDTPFCAIASSLGWGPLDLFRLRPRPALYAHRPSRLAVAARW